MKTKALSKNRKFGLKRIKFVTPIVAEFGKHHTDYMPMQYGVNITPNMKMGQEASAKKRVPKKHARFTKYTSEV